MFEKILDQEMLEDKHVVQRPMLKHQLEYEDQQSFFKKIQIKFKN